MAFEPGNKIGNRFEQGQSGNPNGRPPGAQTSAVRLRRLLEIVQKAKNPVTKETEDFTTLELMDAQQIAKALKGDSVAYNILLDRFEGKVPQRNEFSGPNEQPIQFENVSLEDRLAFLALADKMTGTDEQPQD